MKSFLQGRETNDRLKRDQMHVQEVSGAIPSQEHEDLMNVLMMLWIRYFGPPQQIVLDQQQSLMSHEAGTEFERLGITRSPRGTTAGPAGEQHTGTGLVERHVGLQKLVMMKVRAELNRQGINVENDWLAAEAAMAANQTMSYRGVTPAMSVFGILPRDFYEEDAIGIMASAGALQTDLTVYEKALRIRQTSLAAVQHIKKVRTGSLEPTAHDHISYRLISWWRALQRWSSTVRCRTMWDGEDLLCFCDGTPKRARR